MDRLRVGQASDGLRKEMNGLRTGRTLDHGSRVAADMLDCSGKECCGNMVDRSGFRSEEHSEIRSEYTLKQVDGVSEAVVSEASIDSIPGGCRMPKEIAVTCEGKF